MTYPKGLDLPSFDDAKGHIQANIAMDLMPAMSSCVVFCGQFDIDCMFSLLTCIECVKSFESSRLKLKVILFF